MNKVFITVEGGVIQNITTSTETKIIIIDHDESGDDKVQLCEPDCILGDKVFSVFTKSKNPDEEEMAITHRLKLFGE